MKLDPLLALPFLLINVYIAFLNTLLLDAILIPKPRPSAGLRRLLLLFLCAGALLSGLFLHHTVILRALVGLLFLALSTGLLFQSSFPHRLLAAASFLALVTAAELASAAVVSLYYGQHAHVIASDPGKFVHILPVYLCSYTVFFGIPTFCVWRRPLHKKYTRSTLLQALILPLSQTLLLAAFLYLLYLGDPPYADRPMDGWLSIAVLALCVVTDILFLRAVDGFVAKRQLDEQRKLQKQHYLSLMEQQKSLRNWKHDMVNHLLTLSLLAEEDTGKAKTYLHALTEQIQRVQPVGYCENQIADAVLSCKAAEAAARQVRFSVEALLSESVAIDDLDLMSLLSNLIDNGLDAAALGTDPFVDVHLREQAGTVTLRVRNALAPHTVPDLTRTSKPDNRAHGLGLHIIRGICKKYHGTFSSQQQGDVFEIRVLLLPAKD